MEKGIALEKSLAFEMKGGRLKVLLEECAPSVKLAGQVYYTSEAPSVYIAGRKHFVEAVF